MPFEREAMAVLIHLIYCSKFALIFFQISKYKDTFVHF